nr:hypothetical protein [Candidatus Njordarchaeota archaeon]
MSSPEKKGVNPHLSVLALVSFVSAFLVARTFTTFFPNTVLVGDGLHIHHFWFGLAMLAIGGWLGISYEKERIDRLAAILFGAGGGLIGDEVGLLLTFGNYWTGITYTVVISFLAFAVVMILLTRYWKTITSEFSPFLRGHRILYFSIFLGGVSAAFIMETDDVGVIAVSSVLTITACLIVLAYFIQRSRLRHSEKK